MRPKILFLIFVFILLCIVGIAIAQDDLCEAHEAELSEVVTTVCSTIGNNEVCYGNFLVNLVPHGNVPEPNFSVPGDMADLNKVQSLYLSELNVVDDTWGIAQMHLLAMSSRGTRDVMLLLFGDVRVDNEVENTPRLFVEAFARTNIRSTPHMNAVVIASLGAGETIEAVGRLEDSSWLRVQVAETGAIGWILSDYVEPVAADESFDSLSIQESDKPYFGAMQAMTLTTGSNAACGDFATDGLLIQTPAGTAQVTFLINEVTIELIPSVEIGATAFIQSNPEDGMSVTMIDGTAIVSTESGGFFVDTGTTTTISLDDTSSPLAPPSIPVINYETLDTIDGLDMVGNGDTPVIITITYPDNSGNETDTTTNTGIGADSNASTGDTSDSDSVDDTENPDGTDSTDETDNTDDTGSAGDTVDTDDSSDTNDAEDAEEEECTGPGSSCDAPGHQTDDDCDLGGNACNAASRTD